MSSYDDRLTSLQDLARDAETAMRDLGDDAWPSGEMRERCLGVFAYARVVLESSDGALLSDQAFQLISNAISQFSGSPAQAAQNADPWSSALIDAVGALPVARDRAVEQAVKDAAANFQRSAQQRLNSFDQDVAAARAELETLKTTIDTRKTELATVLDESAGRRGRRRAPNAAQGLAAPTRGRTRGGATTRCRERPRARRDGARRDGGSDRRSRSDPEPSGSAGAQPRPAREHGRDRLASMRFLTGRIAFCDGRQCPPTISADAGLSAAARVDSAAPAS